MTASGKQSNVEVKGILKQPQSKLQSIEIKKKSNTVKNTFRADLALVLLAHIKTCFYICLKITYFSLLN